MTPDKRTIEVKAKNKGMFLSPWVNNDPTIPDKATYWLVDETTDLPVIVDPVGLEQIEEMLNDLPDKDPNIAPIRYMGTELKLEGNGAHRKISEAQALSSALP